METVNTPQTGSKPTEPLTQNSPLSLGGNNGASRDQFSQKSSQKRYLIIGLLLVVLLGGVFFYFVQKGQTPTDDISENTGALNSTQVIPTAEYPIPSVWDTKKKTYKNTELGLSFEYPEDYVLLTGVSGGYDVYLFSSSEK